MVRPIRVLLVDDDRDSRELYAEYLGGRGIEVIHAENGAVGVEEGRTAKPDLIVMDLEMPVMGGLEASAKLKSDPQTRAIPLVVLSANGVLDHERASRAGACACLAKPCAPQDLEGVIRTIVASHWHPAQRAPQRKHR